jgi:hypothetical protein
MSPDIVLGPADGAAEEMPLGKLDDALGVPLLLVALEGDTDGVALKLGLSDDTREDCEFAGGPVAHSTGVVAALGPSEGCEVGTFDGTSEADSDGSCEGSSDTDGISEAVAEGTFDGCADGILDDIGTLDGSFDVSIFVGLSVESDDGTKDG